MFDSDESNPIPSFFSRVRHLLVYCTVFLRDHTGRSAGSSFSKTLRCSFFLPDRVTPNPNGRATYNTNHIPRMPPRSDLSISPTKTQFSFGIGRGTNGRNVSPSTVSRLLNGRGGGRTCARGTRERSSSRPASVKQDRYTHRVSDALRNRREGREGTNPRPCRTHCRQ